MRLPFDSVHVNDQSSVYCSILPSIGEHKLTTCDNDTCDNDNDITHFSATDTDSPSISKLSDSDNASGPSDHTSLKKNQETITGFKPGEQDSSHISRSLVCQSHDM